MHVESMQGLRRSQAVGASEGGEAAERSECANGEETKPPTQARGEESGGDYGEASPTLPSKNKKK